jgi:hypothetical protein
MLRRLAASLALYALATVVSAAPAAETAPGTSAAELAETYLHFVVGRYDLIGRHPDGGKLYAGKASIDVVGGHLRLTREIDGWRGDIFGTIRRADPGETLVLSFAWGEKPGMEMVCLIGSDLDNYPRLTCHWGKVGNPHKKPGMEAYFSREPWEPVR